MKRKYKLKTAPISVMMSTYQGNKASYLKESLDSLNNQTLIPSEIILIIDGVIDDEQMNIIKKFEYAADFRYFQLEKNSGLAHCMNVALNYSTNDIVARMDADDICHPQRFEKQYDIIKNNDNMVCCSWHSEFNYSNKNINSIKKTPENHNEIKKSLALRNIISHPTIITHKKLLLINGGYNEDVGMLEDYELHLRLIHNSVTYYCIQESFVYVRTDENQYLRRSGVKYLLNEYKFRLMCLRHNYISFNDFVVTTVVYTFFRLFPSKYKHILYKVVRGSS